MSWDWRKALQIVNTSAAAATATGAASAGKALSARKGQQEGSNTNTRSGSIVWRTMGLGNFGGSGSLQGQLLEDREYDCPFCHGRGKAAGAGICPVCNGVKKVQVEPPAVKCAFCGGQGQVPARSNLTCSVCRGNGVVSVEPNVQTCPDCQGRGRKPCQSLYCTRCRGVGVVTSHPSRADCRGVSRDIAADCKLERKAS
jgi:RecJ-like exonuclease